MDNEVVSNELSNEELKITLQGWRELYGLLTPEEREDFKQKARRGILRERLQQDFTSAQIAKILCAIDTPIETEEQ